MEKNMNRKNFITAYTYLVKQTMRLNAKRLKLGIPSLEEECEDLDDEDFRRVLYMTVDGVDPAVIDEIFSNKIAFAKDKYARQYNTVLKRAVLGIQAGLNNRILYSVLKSYTGLTPKETKELDNIFMHDDYDPYGPDSEKAPPAATIATYQFNSKRHWAMAIEDIEAELGVIPTGINFGSVSYLTITIKENCPDIGKVTQIITTHGGTIYEPLELDLD
jgi:hypothetical protein